MRKTAIVAFLLASFWPHMALGQEVITARRRVVAGSTITHVSSGQGYCNATTAAGNMSGLNCAAPVATRTINSYVAGAAGNLVMISVSCAAASAPSAVVLTGTGWTWTQLGSITGSATSGFMAVFWAFAPNTTSVTFTQTWTIASCGGFLNNLIDEFHGTNPTTPIDNSILTTNTTGGCLGTITPVANNTMLWSACNDSVTAVGSGFTAGANDTQQDWAQYKQLSGGGGASQSIAFASTGAFTQAGVSIK